MSFKWSKECQKLSMLKVFDIFNKDGLFKLSEDQHFNVDSKEDNSTKSIGKKTKTSVDDSSNNNRKLKQDAEKKKRTQN